MHNLAQLIRLDTNTQEGNNWSKMAVKETPKDYSSMYSEDSGIASLSAASNKSSFSSLSTATISRFLRFDSSKHNNNNNNKNTSKSQSLMHDNNHMNTFTLQPPPIPPIPSSITTNNNARPTNTTLMQQTPTVASPRPSLLGKTTSAANMTNNNNTIANKMWDGSMPNKRNQEMPVDLRYVCCKLEQFKKADHSADALRTLNEHYSTVFKQSRSSNGSRSQVKCNFRVCIKYFNEKDIYVIHIHQNTLKAVRNKLPIRGEFRYFFRDQDNQNVEIESDDSKLPIHDNEGRKQIYCQVFKI